MQARQPSQEHFENQILAQFIQQISGLKTKSVRESRLTNQVRDLRKVFDAEIPPEVEAQRKRRIVGERLIPEFALGGIVPGRDFGRDSVLSFLTPGEMVLTKAQQSAIATMAGGGIFQRAGVPDAGINTGGAQAFQFGGVARAVDAGPLVINLGVEVGVSKSGGGGDIDHWRGDRRRSGRDCPHRPKRAEVEGVVKNWQL